MFWDSVDELFFPGMLDEMFNVYMDLLKRLAKRKELFEEKSASLIQVKISEARKLANETLQKISNANSKRYVSKASRQRTI